MPYIVYHKEWSKDYARGSGFLIASILSRRAVVALETAREQAVEILTSARKHYDWPGDQTPWDEGVETARALSGTGDTRIEFPTNRAILDVKHVEWNHLAAAIGHPPESRTNPFSGAARRAIITAYNRMPLGDEEPVERTRFL